MKRLLSLLISITFFVACGPRDRAGDEAFERVGGITQHRLSTQYLIYEGEIPCIDCDKIDVELWLEIDSVQATSDYWIRTVHRNTAQGDVELEVDGLYSRVRGYRGDPDATIIQLNPGTNDPRYFLLKDDFTLRLLGNDLEKIMDDEEDYSYDLQLRPQSD